MFAASTKYSACAEIAFAVELQPDVVDQTDARKNIELQQAQPEGLKALEEVQPPVLLEAQMARVGEKISEPPVGLMVQEATWKTDHFVTQSPLD